MLRYVTEDVQRLIQEFSESADPIRIRSPYPESESEWLPKFNGNVLVQIRICDKIFGKIRPFCHRYKSNYEKCPISSRNVEESFIKFLVIRMRVTS